MRAWFVVLSIFVVLVLLLPGAALATTPASQDGLQINWHVANSSGLRNPGAFPASAYANGTYLVSSWANVGGRIWASKDARNWSVVWKGNDVPTYIVPGGPGFVAWASGILVSKNGHKWTSANAGVPRRLLNSDYVQLASVNGVVAAFPGSGGGFWSSDGLTWRAIAKGAGPVGPITLAGDGSSLWALTGGRDFDTGTLSPVKVWMTTDGKNWSVTSQLPDSRHSSGLSAAFGPLGGVVIGGARAWYAADGVHWHEATNTPSITAKGPDVINAVVADESGFIVTARRDQPGCVYDPAQSRAITWTSVDGKTWRKMSSTGFLGREIDQLFISGRTLFGISIDWSHENLNGTGVAWRAPLPMVATDNAPPPSPLPKPGNQGC